MPRIIGIDPGSRITGYGIIDVQGSSYRYVASGTIKILAEAVSEKLLQIFSGLQEVISHHQPEMGAIEQVFMQANPSSALKLGQARGVAIVAMARAGLAVSEYSARQVKQAVVGYGAAEKEQVQHMVKRLLNIQGNLQIDASDALGVAICHAMSHRFERVGVY